VPSQSSETTPDSERAALPDPTFSATIYLIYPLAATSFQFADFRRNLDELVDARQLRPEVHTDRPSRSYAEYFPKEWYVLDPRPVPPVDLAGAPAGTTATFRLSVWRVPAHHGTRARVLPMAFECEVRIPAITFEPLIEFARSLDDGRQPLRRSIDRVRRDVYHRLYAPWSAPEVVELARHADAKGHFAKGVPPRPRTARTEVRVHDFLERLFDRWLDSRRTRRSMDECVSESTAPDPARSGPSLPVVRHTSYEVTVLDISGHSSAAMDFVRDYFQGVQGLILRPRYSYHLLDPVRNAELRSTYFYSKELYCNFTIRSGLIIYKSEAEGGTYRHYVDDFLDVFRALRAVWDKASDVLFSLENKFFAPEREDPGPVFDDIKDLFEYLNVAKIEYGSVKGARIYRDLFADGTRNFGITQSLESVEFVTKIEELLSSKWAHANSRLGTVVGVLSLLIAAVGLGFYLDLVVGLVTAVAVNIVLVPVVLTIFLWTRRRRRFR
jgi:hypothetical protein